VSSDATFKRRHTILGLHTRGFSGAEKSNCWRYTITSAASLRFAKLVAPYMHEDLMYKLPSDRPRRKIGGAACP
jgi:hypothetical protein